MRPLHSTLAAGLVAALVSHPAVAIDFDTQDYKVRVTPVVEGLVNPWSVAFLPDGRMLVTERRGTLRIVENGKLLANAIEGIPKSTEHGQGGLLDVQPHPKYAENGWIYWS